MKIKVTRVRGGSMGDQRNYGLVTGSIWNYEDKPSSNQVSETMSPVDRDEATIEAERGETIVGDLNNDGMLEHAIVGGKRHSQGGTPLNVPDGSFVFSDTRSLLIKNKDVLKNIFGITASKGMTPAKVAKRYDLNQYNSLLEDPEADPMSKKTAQMMLDNNLKKLGQLALVQEGMKGFPDGIPDIAMPLFGSDIAVSQASQEGMARRGGLVKAQAGIQVPNIYEDNMQKFNQWKKDWLNALKQNDVKRINQLKTEGNKLVTTLNKVDVPGSLPINFSWLDPNTREVSWGTQEGKLADAADVIDNYLSEYEASGKRAQKAAEAYKNQYNARKEAQNLFNSANAIIKDYQTKGGASVYNEKDINNAYTILEKFKPDPYYQQGQNVFDPGAATIISFNPLTDLSLTEVNKLKEDYPLSKSLKQSAPVQKITAEEKAYAENPADTTEINPIAPADTNGINIQVNTTGNGPSAITRVPKINTELTDADIISIMKAQGVPDSMITPETIQARKGYRDGGNLPKHQATGVTGNTEYDLFNKAVREAAAAKNKTISFPYSYYDPNLTSIPSQTGKRGYVVSDEGFLYRPGQKPPRADEYVKNVPIDWNSYKSSRTGKTGADAWKEDIKTARGKESEASLWAANQADDYVFKESGARWFNRNQPDWAVPGRQFSTIPIFGEAAPAAAPAVSTLLPAGGGQDTFPTSPAAPPTPNYIAPNYRQPWSNYSMVDYLAAMGNYMDVRRGKLPTLYQYAPVLPDATFLDPARAIAQQQGLVAQSTEDIASRSMDPTTARANIIAAQAQSADPIANIQAKYDEANAQIANQLEQQRASTLNDAQLKNIAFREQYQQNLETLEQQYQNALREGRTEVAETIKRAMVDAMHRGALNVQNPNIAIGPNGVIYVKPGYNPTTGENSLTASASNPKVEMYKKLRQEGQSEKDAKNIMDLMYGKGAQTGGTMSFGAYNPIDYIWG